LRRSAEIAGIGRKNGKRSDRRCKFLKHFFTIKEITIKFKLQIVTGTEHMAAMDDRKKRIMEHLARSTGDFIKSSSAPSPERKQRIMDHVKRTKG
jgi:hypothetical protein